jgi:ethanolamine ammonia-lyase small subunit
MMDDDSARGDALVQRDPWQALRRLTPARIALGRVGASLPTAEVLRFGLAHAQAQDAVQRPFDARSLAARLEADGWATLGVASRAATREHYLLRPDLGRRLDDASAARLDALAATEGAAPELVFVAADGLSSLAAERHAPALLAALRPLLPRGRRIGPIVVARQARVALGDEIGERLGASLVVVLIGERPGLSSPDSLGLYLTHAPRVGRVDAERNCISNVRAGGLAPQRAAARLAWLVAESMRRGLSGVQLKEASASAGDAGQGAP